jgi:hypothetical protein
MPGTCEGDELVSVPDADWWNWKRDASARTFISSLPTCQCMDSADRQGIPSSVATICHICSLKLLCMSAQTPRKVARKRVAYKRHVREVGTENAESAG